MKRFETEAAKQEAIDTLRLLMSSAGSDGSFRGYAQHLNEVLARPVAPEKCAYCDCPEDVERGRSYCRKHFSGSWTGVPGGGDDQP